jgi:outer membrane autotransporter protein
VINSNFRLNRLTQNHLAAVRGSARTHRKVGTYSDDAKCSMPGPVTSTVTGRGNVWGTISYDNQDFEGDTNQADFEGDTGTFTAGVDWLVAPQLILGLVFDGSRSDLDGQNADSTDVDSFRAAAYGTWGGAMGLYSDFMVGVGDHDLENTKSFALLGNLSSDTDATSVQALWTVGYTMGNDQVKHGPFAGFEYQRLDVDGYAQGGIVPIAVGDYDIDSLRALLGYRVDATYGNFNPYAAVAYSHEFQNSSNKANATVGGQPFTVVGAEQSSAFLVSIGTGYTLTDALTLDFGYRGEMATDDGITSHGASLGLNYAF